MTTNNPISRIKELRKTINANDRYIQEQTDIVKNESSKITWYWIIFIVGLILCPVIVGILICICAWHDAKCSEKIRDQAKAAIQQARIYDEQAKNEIIDLESELRVLTLLK